MVSLSYFDEHLAWQQRVQKEISTAYHINPQSENPNTKLIYKIVPNDLSSNHPSSRQQLLPNLGNLNIYSEVRGKYSRPVINQNPLDLPQVKSRTSTSVISNRKSRKSSISKKSFLTEDAEGKSIQELQKMLRQERLVKTT
ncbi:hypothetical protein SteCoe_8244 [Stentor coeruleus]|uniref:Uncharacterized protein n=1 Tax=Stentor coeruleus TaxID=5963 RepID=A0A1R2CKJ8_9CILI|nr:hypothetical protein SteCoe_8244 [Stentor coeruleus]